MEDFKMKNKRLVVVIGILVVVVLGSVIFSQFGKKEASPTKEIPTVGVLQFVSHPALDTIYQGIQDGLKENGYDPEKNTVKIEFQNGQADQSKLSTMSQQLIDKKSDVLIGIATPAAQALATTTKDIPIILGAITDPMSAGLVKDNEKPGGNITGVSDKSPVDAQFELVSKLLPEAKTVGVLYSSAEDNSDYQAKEVQKEAQKKGLDVKLFPVPSENEISQIVQVMSDQVDFIYIPTDNTMANAMQTIVDAANKKNTPIIPSVDTMVEQGGLATVSINQYDLGVQTGKMAADVLSGKAKPATTPVYTFTTGDTIINQKQAEKLGIKIPEELLKEAKIVNE